MSEHTKTYDELLSSYQSYQKIVREAAECGCFACPDGDWTDPMTPLKVHHCPLHGAAGDLLAALQRAITYQHDPSMWVEQARVTVQKAE